MVLNNQFLIDLINSKSSAKVKKGEDFRCSDVFQNEWDIFCDISFDEYIKRQADPTFLSDIEEIGQNRTNVGIVIPDVTQLPIEKAKQLNGNAKIYIFNPEEERMSNNSYMFLSEYIEALQTLEDLMQQIDLSDPGELKKAKQIFTLLRKQYEHGFSNDSDVLTNVRRSQNIYGCLCLHKGVCRGGANTFRAMCSLANIKCRVLDIEIIDKGEPVIGHAFNEICINGEWGIVDVEQKKDNPEYSELFFCNEDVYEDFWKQKTYSYQKSSRGCTIIPTNVSASTREYIESLETADTIHQSSDNTGTENLRTLAMATIFENKVSIGEIQKVATGDKEFTREEGIDIGSV